jgi:protein-tyrosine-phosphatase
MSKNKYNVLFLCTGNSARSIIAEAVMNSLTMTQSRFHAYSAGSFPKDEVNPMALEVLQSAGFSTEGLRSKSWDEFARPGAPELDFVFTVCDNAAGEVCPVWPGQPMTAHWGVPDPAAVEGPENKRRHAFEETLMALHRRIELFASLPLESIDSMTLSHHIKSIGQQ